MKCPDRHGRLWPEMTNNGGNPVVDTNKLAENIARNLLSDALAQSVLRHPSLGRCSEEEKQEVIHRIATARVVLTDD